MIALQQFLHCNAEQVRVVPVVEPEGNLAQIGGQLQLPKSTDRPWRFELRLERNEVCTNPFVMSHCQNSARFSLSLKLKEKLDSAPRKLHLFDHEIGHARLDC